MFSNFHIDAMETILLSIVGLLGVFIVLGTHLIELKRRFSKTEFVIGCLVSVIAGMTAIYATVGLINGEMKKDYASTKSVKTENGEWNRFVDEYAKFVFKNDKITK